MYSETSNFWITFFAFFEMPLQKRMKSRFCIFKKKRKQEAQLLLGDRATRMHAKGCWNGRGNDILGWNDLKMYFKVIESGTNRKQVYDFLLVE